MKKELFLVGLLVLAVAISGCTQPPDGEDGNPPITNGNGLPITERDYLIGVGPIPRQFPSNQEGWQDMFNKVNETGEIVLAQNEWRDKPESSGEIPEIIKLIGEQRSVYNYTPVFGINFFTTGKPEKAVLDTLDSPTPNDWTNEDAKQKYKEVALAICKNFDAEYLGLGIEVNDYYYHHKEDFDRFVEAYKEMYNEIKSICPNTKLFVSFQLEMMKGLGNKTWGTKVWESWNLIEKFDNKLDLIAFTTYPEVEFDSPEAIPNEYYSSIIKELPESYKGKIAFAEIGWSSTKNSEADQSRFLTKFLEITEDLDKEFVIWAFMHDLQNGPLTKIGLRTYNGEAKNSWFKWKTLKGLPKR